MKNARLSLDLNERLTRLETFAQQLIEGNLARLFRSHLDMTDVVARLAHAVEDNARPLPDGGRRAPDLITISFAPSDYAELMHASSDLADRLAATMRDLSLQAGYQLDNEPSVDVQADASVPLHMMVIDARHSQIPIPGTQPLRVVQPPPAPPTPV